MKRSSILVLALAIPLSGYVWACSSSSSGGGTTNEDGGPGADGNSPNNNDGGPGPGTDGSVPESDGSMPGTDGSMPMGVNPIAAVTPASVGQLAGGVGGGNGFVGGLRYFGGKLYANENSDITNTATYTIDLDAGTPTQFRFPANGSIGLSVDTKKTVLLVTEAYAGGAPNVGDLARLFSDGGTSVVASTYDAGGNATAPMDSPNDVTTRKSDGMMFVTDPAYQSATNTGIQHVYSITATGTVQVIDVCVDGCRPNGIALSPDEKTLYVGYSYTGVAGTPPVIKKFAVAANGTLSGAATFASPGADPDGFAIDTAGNLYVACAAGVKVYAPNGTAWGTILVPGNVAGSLEPNSLAFGGADGKTLYIGAFSDIYDVVVAVAGRTDE